MIVNNYKIQPFANLQYTNLQYADLQYANLRSADLQYADLQYANLQYTNLQYADLQYANLRSADLQYADLQYANLRGADLQGATLPDFQIPQEVDLIVYKKLRKGVICKLLIPKEAKRTASLVGNKCRAEYAIVLEGEGYSIYDPTFKYEPGMRIVPDRYDGDIRVECKPGIHFFMKKEDANAYD